MAHPVLAPEMRTLEPAFVSAVNSDVAWFESTQTTCDTDGSNSCFVLEAALARSSNPFLLGDDGQPLLRHRFGVAGIEMIDLIPPHLHKGSGR